MLLNRVKRQKGKYHIMVNVAYVNLKKQKLWDEKAMIAAMKAVKSDGMGVKRAELEDGIPKTTSKQNI